MVEGMVCLPTLAQSKFFKNIALSLEMVSRSPSHDAFTTKEESIQ